MFGLMSDLVIRKFRKVPVWSYMRHNARTKIRCQTQTKPIVTELSHKWVTSSCWKLSWFPRTGEHWDLIMGIYGTINTVEDQRSEGLGVWFPTSITTLGLGNPWIHTLLICLICSQNWLCQSIHSDSDTWLTVCGAMIGSGVWFWHVISISHIEIWSAGVPIWFNSG